MKDRKIWTAIKEYAEILLSPREYLQRVSELAEEAKQNIHMEFSLEEYACSRGRTSSDYVSSHISSRGLSSPLYPPLAKDIAFIEMEKKRMNRGYETIDDAKLITWIEGGGGAPIRPHFSMVIAELSGLGIKLKESIKPNVD